MYHSKMSRTVKGRDMRSTNASDAKQFNAKNIICQRHSKQAKASDVVDEQKQYRLQEKIVDNVIDKLLNHPFVSTRKIVGKIMKDPDGSKILLRELVKCIKN